MTAAITNEGTRQETLADIENVPTGYDFSSAGSQSRLGWIGASGGWCQTYRYD